MLCLETTNLENMTTKQIVLCPVHSTETWHLTRYFPVVTAGTKLHRLWRGHGAPTMLITPGNYHDSLVWKRILVYPLNSQNPAVALSLGKGCALPAPRTAPAGSRPSRMSLLTQAYFLPFDKVIIKQGISSDAKQLVYGNSDKIIRPK